MKVDNDKYRPNSSLWFLTMMINTFVSSHQIRLSGESEVFNSAQDAIATVLRESWQPSCSLVFVTDTIIPFISVSKLLLNLRIKLNVAAFEVSTLELNRTSISTMNVYRHIEQIHRTSRCLTLVGVSDDENFMETFLTTAIQEGLLIWPTRLLLITRRPILERRDFRESLSFINGLVVILQETSKLIRCRVYMCLPYSHRVVHLASWSPYSGIYYHSEYELFPDKFSRLIDGAHLRVVGNNFPLHVIIKKIISSSDSGEMFSFTGPLVLVLKMLASNMNFTYTLRQPSDGSWGYRFTNGSWNGMIGMMIRKEVDFALGPFGVTYIRSKVIDYTNPLIMDYGRILGRRGDTEIDPWGFVMPLTPFVWASVFASLFVIIGIATLVSWTDQFTHRGFSKVPLSSYVRVFLQQDIIVASDSKWEKMMLGFWMLSVLILIECYSTNLMSLLAVRYISEPYQSVRDMLDDPTLKMVWVANTAYAQHLADVDSGIFYEVKEAGNQGRIRYISAPQYITSVDELVSRGDHVLINPLIIMKIFLTESYMDKGNCKFYVSKETFLPQTFCMVVPKNSPLRRPINEGIRAVVEGGLYNYWLDNAIPNAKSCKHPPTRITVKVALSLSNLWGVFVVLVAGYLMSVLVLLLEMIQVILK